MPLSDPVTSGSEIQVFGVIAVSPLKSCWNFLEETYDKLEGLKGCNTLITREPRIGMEGG